MRLFHWTRNAVTGSELKNEPYPNESAEACINDAADTKEAALDGPGEEKQLTQLPNAVLQHVMQLLQQYKGSHAVRATCRCLRDAYDGCNTTLAFGSSAGPHAQPSCLQALLTRLTQQTPALTHLCFSEFLTSMDPVQILRATVNPSQLLHISLHPKQRVDLALFGSCTALQYLHLHCCVLLSDLKALSACTALQHLDLSRCCIYMPDSQDASNLSRTVSGDADPSNAPKPTVSSLTPLTALRALQHLDLSRSCLRVSDLSPLAACTALQHLDLHHCPGVSDVSPLAACAALQYLDLCSCQQVSDLAPLAACILLQHLDLGHCRNLWDLTPLAACTALQHLNLCSCSNISDLTALAACTALQHLTLDSCPRISNLAPLAACTALRQLNLRYFRHAHDLAPLAACPALGYLKQQDRDLWYQHVGPLCAGCCNWECIEPFMM